MALMPMFCGREDMVEAGGGVVPLAMERFGMVDEQKERQPSSRGREGVL